MLWINAISVAFREAEDSGFPWRKLSPLIKVE